MGLKDIDFLANWDRAEGSAPKKLVTSLRNNWKKVRTRSTCCGNHGEPGC
jgi:hypothetical protein